MSLILSFLTYDFYSVYFSGIRNGARIFSVSILIRHKDFIFDKIKYHLYTVTYKNYKTVPVTCIILSRTLSNILDLSEKFSSLYNLILLIKALLIFLAELFVLLNVLFCWINAKTQVFLNAYCFKARRFYLR
ncbi:hypothetical protein HNP24_003200 [Chryseobacterium sediminis]|uniref:Uncharacterized protein n=1 Tax=Chryseobacterium sediminis TaxID=1679494 RepID=A0ABR6Q517_9FLAO|nr:hypothetical protein [Chryseobacterium sediminis]